MHFTVSLDSAFCMSLEHKILIVDDTIDKTN